MPKPAPKALLLLLAIAAALVINGCSATRPYCSENASDASPTVVIDDIAVVFNGGESSGHSFVINLCKRTSNVPTPSRKRNWMTAEGFVSQFGPAASRRIGCEVAFDDVLQEPAWLDDSTIVASYASKYPQPYVAEVTVSCSDAPTHPNTVSVSPDRFYRIHVHHPQLCSGAATGTPSNGSDKSKSSNTTKVSVTDVAVGSVVGIVVVIGIYAVVAGRLDRSRRTAREPEPEAESGSVLQRITGGLRFPSITPVRPAAAPPVGSGDSGSDEAGSDTELNPHQ